MSPINGPLAACQTTYMTGAPWQKRNEEMAVYVGQIYMNGSTNVFAKSFDDGVYLAIDGEVLIQDIYNQSTNPNSWKTTRFVEFYRPAGWYDFDLRLFNNNGDGGAINQDGWGTAAFGFGYNNTGATGKHHSNYWYPEDDGNMSLFRYDDGFNPEEMLVIAGMPEKVGVAAPAFGTHVEIKAPSNFPVSVSAVWTNVPQNNVIAIATGWELFKDTDGNGFVTHDSGTEAAFQYDHPGFYSKLVWKFAISNLITATAGAGGSVSGGGWCASTNSLLVEATAAAGNAFFKWDGDVPAGMERINPLTLPGDKPRVVEALFSSIIHVTMDGNDGNDGSSFEDSDAMLTIGAAVAAAASNPSGGLVLVAPGRYETTSQIYVTAPVTVRGASGVAEDVVVANTTFSGIARVFVLNDADARLEFMTITDGYSDGNHNYGGNIFIDSNGGTVADCVVRNGFLAHNSEMRGGNIFMRSADALVLRCVITNGVTPDQWMSGGGGVCIDAGRVEQCFIAYNTSRVTHMQGNQYGIGGGSGVMMRGPSVLENCTIARNAGTYAAAVNADHASAVVRNCVIVDNAAPAAPAGSILQDAAQAGRFINCVADMSVNSTCLTTSGSFGFVDAARDNYRLTPLAIALDAGAAPSASASTTDLDGNPRVVNGTIDAGCYEYQNSGAGGVFDFSFDVNRTSRKAIPLDIACTGAVINAQGPTVTYTWDFGDGSAPADTTVPYAEHRYTDIGEFLITVTAFDGVASVIREHTERIATGPGVIYVSENADNPQSPYDSIETAADSIHAALDIAVNGSIVIASGFFTLPDEIVVEKAVEIRGATGDPEDTVFSRGNYWNRIMSLNNRDAFVSGITMEKGGDAVNLVGANLYIGPLGGAVSNCVIRNGYTRSHHGRAGGIYMESPHAFVTHCVITNNSFETAAGYNKAGGVEIHNGVLANSLVAGNRAPDADAPTLILAGGVLLVNGSVVNCTIAGNFSRQHGGICIAGAGTVVNTAIAGNISQTYGGDAVAWGGPADAYDHCAMDAAAPNDSCVSRKTAAELLADVAHGNFHPAAGSPLIDSGLEIANPPAVDLEGNARVQGDPPAIDIGCYETDPGAFTISFSSDVREGLLPDLRVIFTASVSGAAPEDIRLSWDFYGENEEPVFDAADFTATNIYSTAGFYTATLTATNLLTGQTASHTKENHIYCVQKNLYVDSANAANAEFPYNGWTNAALNIHNAVNAAIDGCEIIIREGEYILPNTGYEIVANKALRIRSENGNPESVKIVYTFYSTTTGFPVLMMNNRDAFASGMTFVNGRNRDQGGNVHFDTRGGTVSNCVLRGGSAFSDGQGGAAAHLKSADAFLTHCVITNNHVENSGRSRAIMKIESGRVENSLITRNYDAGVWPPASTIEISGGVMRNCTIAGNTSTSLSVVQATSGAIEHCVIAGNTMTNTFAVGNANIFVSCTTDEPDLNESGNCRYETAGEVFKNHLSGNYQLNPSSLAIDTGPRLEDWQAAAAGLDLAGRPRAINNRIDDGCYESLGRATMIMLR